MYLGSLNLSLDISHAHAHVAYALNVYRRKFSSLLSWCALVLFVSLQITVHLDSEVVGGGIKYTTQHVVRFFFGAIR
jgi:uncharacterized membrane protein